jgi:pimeloyl-[acyl-carrier protein] methyl ester esterase
MKWHTNFSLILLPGLDGTGHLFQPLLQAMPDEINISIVKYPSNKRFSYKQLVDYAVEQLPQNKPLFLLAESFSGPIAIGLLSASHHDIRGVIFCATFANPPRPLLLRLVKILPLAVMLRLPIPTAIIRYFCLGQDAPQSLVTQFQKVLNEVPISILGHRLKILANINVVSSLANLAVPCCYIQATEDKLVPSVNLKPFQDALPHLLIRKIVGPHFILQTKPTACAEVIKDFINRNTQTF